MSRKLDGDGDLEVELIDAPDDRDVRTVELRPRRRGRELALAAAGIAVVIGVGLVGDGADEDVAAAPTTTTTQRRATTSTSRPHRVVTTTTWPQHEAGTGPLLPGDPTGASIGVVSGSGRITVVDLDTGDRCETMPSQGGTWMPWNLQTQTAGRMIVQTNDTLVAVDRACAMTPIAVDLHDAYPTVIADHSVWMSSGIDPYLTEISIPDGEATGRTIDMPRFGSSNAFALGDDVLLATIGDMTIVDPDTGERTSLGTGTPLATRGDLVAFTTCPEARCRLGVVDVGTGRRRLFDDIEPVPWNQSSFSADGRLLQISVAGARRDQPVGAIVDVTTGSIRVLDDPMQTSVFTPDNRWLIASFDGRMAAYRIDRSVADVDLDGLRGDQGLALL